MKFFDKLKNKKNILIFFVLFFSLIFLFLPQPVAAGIDDVFAWLIGGLSRIIVSVLGFILVQVIGVLVKIAQYNNFINETPIANGWALIRDISNMFFVIILLVIAFATILRIERYNYKKWLPKLLMMAILINFSKTICGLLIDATQVVMLTFVGAFASIGSASVVELLGISDWQSIKSTTADVSGWIAVAIYGLSVIYVLISLIIITAMTAMLAMRIVMIWLYVVLSPLAFLMAAFPDGAKYSSQWWSDFTKNLIVGPVLAFFIWLAFTSVASFGDSSIATGIGPGGGEVLVGDDANTLADQDGVRNLMIKFIIGIGMLIGGMQITQQIGGVAGGMAGKAFSKGKNMALLGAGAIGGYALARAKGGAKNLGMAAVNQKFVRTGLDKIGAQRGVIGQALRISGVRGLARQGSIALGQHKLAVEEKAKKKVDALKKAGASETVASIAEGRADTMSQKAAQKEAKKMFVVPQEKFDKTRGLEGLTDPRDKREAEERIKAFDLKKESPSLNQIMQLGKSGINLNNVPKFREMLEKNTEARGAYNSGQRDAGLRNYVVGRDRNGRELTGRGRYGVMMTSAADRDKATGRTGLTTYAFRTAEKNEEDQKRNELKEKINYHQEGIASSKKGFAKDNREEIQFHQDKIKDLEKNYKTGNTEKIKFHKAELRKAQNTNIAYNNYKEDDGQVIEHRKGLNDAQIELERLNKKEKKGAGNLSINSFVKRDSAMGVDFSKLDPGIQAEMQTSLKEGQNLSDIKGASTDDKEKIKSIASSLVKIIDQEIKNIKNKGENISKSDQLRLGNLEQSKNKLKKPENLENLKLINSSAKGYTSYSDVKETIIHEGLHGLGVDSEDDVDYMTKRAMESPKNIRVREGGDKFLELLEEKMDKDRGVSSGKGKMVEKVLASERQSQPEGYSLRTGEITEEIIRTEENIQNIKNIENITSAASKDKLKQDFANNLTKNSSDSFMGYYFKNLISSLNKLSSNLSKQELKKGPNQSNSQTFKGIASNKDQGPGNNNLEI